MIVDAWSFWNIISEPKNIESKAGVIAIMNLNAKIENAHGKPLRT